MITYTLGSEESSYEIDFLHIMEEVGYEFNSEQQLDLQNRIEVCLTLLVSGMDITDELRESVHTATLDIINAWLEDINDLELPLWADTSPIQYAVKFKYEGATDVTTIPNE
ncbi:conserved hypothetical protein [Vibrio phage 150E35-1]|nr:conserved hypothetical protein [Vibrio phage 150E35-1]